MQSTIWLKKGLNYDQKSLFFLVVSNQNYEDELCSEHEKYIFGNVISSVTYCTNIKLEMRSFKSNENIHKKEGGSYYVVLANKASSVTL